MPPTSPILIGGRLRRPSPTDVTDAVAAARAALPEWSGLPAIERGRRLAEVVDLLDERRDRFPAAEVAAAADRWLWYAGWTDKLAHLVGAVHPVDGPYASWSAPRPVGVVGAVAPPGLLAMVDALGAALAVGATVVVVAPPAPALAELLALTALPANLLTDGAAALAAAVDGFDPSGADPGVPRMRAWCRTQTVWQSAGR